MVSALDNQKLTGSFSHTRHWAGGRKGIYKEAKDYRGLAKGEKGEAPAGSFDGYLPLVEEIMKFFQTGITPVKPEETLEMFAFMEAADQSKLNNGAPASIPNILKAAGATP